MYAPPLKPLARWKYVEVIYERLSSGGLNTRQRDRLRAELERTLHVFQLEAPSRCLSPDSPSGPPSPLPAP